MVSSLDATRAPETQRVANGTENGFSRMAVQPSERPTLSGWRCTGLAVLRIVFGLVWLIDANFKWLPGFHDHLDAHLEKGAEGQPAVVRARVNFWINVIEVHPHFVSNIFAVAETALVMP